MGHESTTKTLLASTALVLSLSLQPAVSSADSSRYPQYVQQTLPKGVEPEFIYLTEFVDEIRAGKKPLIVDVRSAGEYREGHITGSVSIPLGDMAKRLAEIPKDRSVVLYWACPHHLASLAYGILHQKGYRNMKVLYEGLPGWIEKGYPLDRGA